MKRFAFRLQRVLDLRARAEDEAKQELAKAVGVLVGIEQRLKETAEEIVRAAKDRFKGGRSVAELRASELYLVRLEKTKQSLLEAAAKAELEVQRRREVFVEASRERKVIEKVQDKKKAEHKKAAEKEEAQRLDEIAGNAYIRSMGDRDSSLHLADQEG